MTATTLQPSAEVSASNDQPSAALERWLFLLLVAIQLLPIWAVGHLPTDDGASHIYNSTVLRQYNHPDRAIFREYFEPSARPDPNWFTHLALMLLTALVSGPTAEKILVSGYIILLPLAVRYALRAINPASGWLAILSLPFVYNFLMQKGFYNFSYSLAAYFFLIGYWLRHHDRRSLWHGIGLCALSLVVYFCHLISVVTAYALLGTLILLLVARDTSRESFAAALRRHVLMPLIAFAPTIFLVLIYMVRQGMRIGDVAMYKKDLKLAGNYSLVLFESYEIVFAVAISLFIGLAALWMLVRKWRGRTFQPLDGLFLAAALYGALALLTPNSMAGGGLIIDRLVLYPFFALILWLGTRTYQPTGRRITQTFAAVITLAMLLSRTVSYVRINDYTDEYLSVGPHIRAGSTLLALPFSNRIYTPDGRILSSRVFPLNHANGFIAAERGLVDLANYEATTGYFQLIYRPGRQLLQEPDPPQAMDTPPQADFLNYPAQSGGRRVDYVLLWLVRPEQMGDPVAKAIFRQLDAGYDLIYTSSPRGYAKLYRRKEGLQ